MSLLAPSMQRYGSSHSQMDARAASRADSVLDYYISGANSRDISPNRLLKTAMNGSREKVSQSSMSRMGSSNSHRLSENFMYDEFGYDSRYQAIIEPKVDTPTSEHTVHSVKQKDLVKGTTAENAPLRREYSLSRIPIPRDRYSNHSIAGEATRVPYEANSKDNLSETVTRPTREGHIVPQLALNNEMTLYTSLPKSTSMPLDQLAKIRTSFDDTVMNKFGSLPSRKARNNNQSGIQRSASLTNNTRHHEFKDHRALREEQARRIQLINQAPSGPPPWLGKFQPDPRLPADQQMLPTVARKLALEQWIEDGGAEESFDSMWETHKTWTSPASKRASMYDSPSLSTTKEEHQNNEFQSPPLASTSRFLNTPQTEPHLSPILGQNPSTSLHRQTSSFGTNMPNFSRRSIHNVGSPQPNLPGHHSRTESSAPSSDRRLTDTTEQLAIAPLPFSENVGLGLVDANVLASGRSTGPPPPQMALPGQESSSSSPCTTQQAVQGNEPRHRHVPVPRAAEPATISPMHRHAGPQGRKEAETEKQRKLEKQARCCVVM